MSLLRAIRAEWTKLRSVRGTALALLTMVLLTLALGTVGAWQATSDANQHPLTYDQFHFVHRPMDGDGSITARVDGQAATAPWAKAGLMLKASTASGAPYAAVMVTPAHGVRVQADFRTELTGAASVTGPRWLRLTRSGPAVTAADSADGTTWHPIGTVTVPGLPARVEAGLFVASPPTDVTFGEGSVSRYLLLGEATFDQITLAPAATAGSGAATGPPAAWQDTDVSPPPSAHRRGAPEPGPDDVVDTELLPGASTHAASGAVTVRGSGDIGYANRGGIVFGGGSDSLVTDSLLGVRLGLIGAVILGVLFMTAEFKAGTMRTTFTVAPRRGQVLAAKSIVLTTVTFLVALVPCVAARFIAPPLQHRAGYGPPAYTTPSFGDPGVVRPVLGTALVLALIALLSMAVGTLLRRTSAVMVLLAGFVVAPTVLSGLSETADAWLGRFTPIAGLAIQQTTYLPGRTFIGPWAGLGVLGAYTAVLLAAAYWRLRSRDA
jgi:regulation of enolase protein 1 (concanavalin A-like superfamily)